MGAPMISRARDEALLDMLHVQATEGTAVARARFGMTNSQVQGKLHTTVRASDAIPCLCDKPENRDGGMPPRWWAR